VSAGAVVLLQAANYSLSRSFVTFKYGVSGDHYPWYEQFIVGPNQHTYFIVGVSVGSFVAFLLLLALIWAIVLCCRGCCCKTKVQPEAEVNKTAMELQSLEGRQNTHVGNTIKLDDLLPEEEEDHNPGNVFYANNRTRTNPVFA